MFTFGFPVYIVHICIIDGALSMLSSRGCVPDIRLGSVSRNTVPMVVFSNTLPSIVVHCCPDSDSNGESMNVFQSHKLHGLHIDNWYYYPLYQPHKEWCRRHFLLDRGSLTVALSWMLASTAHIVVHCCPLLPIVTHCYPLFCGGFTAERMGLYNFIHFDLENPTHSPSSCHLSILYIDRNCADWSQKKHTEFIMTFQMFRFIPSLSDPFPIEK